MASVFKAPGGFEVKAPVESAGEFEVLDPGNLEGLAHVSDMGKSHAEEAIQAASAALPGWAARTAQERSKVLETIHDLMHAHRDDLAHIITSECGKPYAEAYGEVAYAASFFKWFAEEGRRAYGDVVPPPASSKRIITIKQPVGVCAAVTPWNFPSGMITRKLAPALAVGCTMVVKPAEDTPLSALAILNLAEEAGLPPGAFGVVTASRANTPEVGSALCRSPIVRKMSFTGSTAVGKSLYAECADTVKRVSLELGGNAPFIVFDDADIDKAVEGAIASKFRNSGQTCVCANRFFVHARVYDEFAEKLAKRAASMKMGHGLEEGVVQGPLINEKAMQKVMRTIDHAVASGAEALSGGERRADLKGYFVEPTVLIGATHEMGFSAEETFGPVAPLIRFESDEEVVAWSNDTTAGLAAYFYTSNVHRAFRVAEALEYGMVGINDGIVSTEVAPFGGVKESGLGREGSREGLSEYLETKYMCFGGF